MVTLDFERGTLVGDDCSLLRLGDIVLGRHDSKSGIKGLDRDFGFIAGSEGQVTMKQRQMTSQTAL